MSIVTRGLSILCKEGLIAFLKKSFHYIKKEFILYRGVTTLSIDDSRVRVNIPSENLFSKTKTRFEEEQDELRVILRELSDGDVFFDVGANTGIYSIFVANNCTQCTVVSFEPYSPNIDELKENIALNNISDSITIISSALSDKSDTVYFTAPDDSTPGYGTGSISTNQSEISVNTCRGDDLISRNDVPQPNIVKIDVEGTEPLVIDGLTEALSNEKCRMVVCELHPSELSKYDYSSDDIVTEFKKMGYSTDLRSRWSEGSVLTAKRK